MQQRRWGRKTGADLVEMQEMVATHPAEMFWEVSMMTLLTSLSITQYWFGIVVYILSINTLAATGDIFLTNHYAN